MCRHNDELKRISTGRSRGLCSRMGTSCPKRTLLHVSSRKLRGEKTFVKNGFSFLFSQLMYTIVNLRWKCCEIESKNAL